jgi:nicotinate phosphoribosyltransferase
VRSDPQAGRATVTTARAPEPWVGESNAPLLLDLYQLTMVQAYWREALHEAAVFSLFVRRLPSSRNFLVAAGLDDVLRFLERFRFDGESLEFLAGRPEFGREFVDWLAGCRFAGEVRALPEGTPFFANEPILEVRAPLAEAQLVETFIMNQIQLQTLLASKAARVVRAAAGRPVLDFGLRRMHGTDAGLKAARAFHIAGVAGTSNVLAGRIYGVPIGGTMAHSYIQAHESELASFRAFAALYPRTTLLVDTYDTIEGVRNVVRLAAELGDDFAVRAVRLDSGDLGQLAREARAVLDEAGLTGVQIFASGGLNEYEIARLLAEGAPIDAFGVGTDMGVSADAPALDIAYKLSEYSGEGRLKLSAGKPVLPGAKQVFRSMQGGGATSDVIARLGEDLPGEPLLVPVMRDGRRLAAPEPLERARERAAAAIGILPERVRALEPADPPYAVEPSAALARLQREIEAQVGR